MTRTVRSGRLGRWSLAGQLLVLQVIIVGLLVIAGAALSYLDIADRAEESTRNEVVSVALTIADSPVVTDAVRTDDPSALLQPFAERVRHDTGVDFITIMDPTGRRYTHPNPERIGGQFLGHTEQALAGNTFTETYTGTLGPSVRAVVPVYGTGENVVALVSVGITLDSIAGQVRERLVPLGIVAGTALVVAMTGTFLVNRRVARQTHGLGPAELSRRIEYHEAILHTVREGLLLLDQDGRVTLINDGARTLLDLTGDVEGRLIDELGLPPDVVASLSPDGTSVDEIRLTERRVLVVNSAPVRSGSGDLGTVVTLRDHTDLQALTGELNSVRGFAESLRSQAHEAANRLHTVVSLVELGRTEEAVEFATAELALAQQLTDRVVGAVSEPVLAALLLGKAAEANERGAELVITPETEIDDAVLGGDQATARDVVTILGNLIDNGLDAALDGTGTPRVFVTARTEDGELVLRVADTGGGLAAESVQEAFARGWSTKGTAADGTAARGLGLALVRQAVRRNRGIIEVGDDSAGGAVFTVHLPSAKEREPTGPRNGGG
ncbi:ATP-binding protein [Actinophytocola gossypii]|uniref:histidine kinase n=1 Tax=Actinophytocola gossypii TaxID=2812003 RepID=A0ABT2JGL2_9PSEU|nr:sensor histidine kinase [Actinophytocola gossypii]MCT2586993.1 sensor histidine kinase [Actinophytocola gossypii]